MWNPHFATVRLLCHEKVFQHFLLLGTHSHLKQNSPSQLQQPAAHVSQWCITASMINLKIFIDRFNLQASNVLFNRDIRSKYQFSIAMAGVVTIFRLPSTLSYVWAPMMASSLTMLFYRRRLSASAEFCRRTVHDWWRCMSLGGAL
jgi:hypothetical protein